MNINILRGYAFFPNASTWQGLHGIFDFDHTPIAPAGMRIVCLNFLTSGVPSIHTASTANTSSLPNATIAALLIQRASVLQGNPHDTHYRLHGATPDDEVTDFKSTFGLQTSSWPRHILTTPDDEVIDCQVHLLATESPAGRATYWPSR